MVSVKLRPIMQGVSAVKHPGQKTMLINVPLFHAAGLFVALLYGIGTGRKGVIFSGRWNAAEACRLIALHKVTNFYGVPLQAIDLVESEAFARHDMSSLVAIGAGGSAAPSRMVEAVNRLGLAPTNGYGLTETSAGSTPRTIY